MGDSRENLYLSDLKGLIDVYMLKHIFKNWKKVLIEEKVVIQNILTERYVKCSYFLLLMLKFPLYVKQELV